MIKVVTIILMIILGFIVIFFGGNGENQLVLAIYGHMVVSLLVA